MPMLPEIAVQGWILPDSTRKYHYYHDSQTISLCGRYDIRSAQLDEAYDNNHSCADNCAACQRKRLQLENAMNELTEREESALESIRNGADVYAYGMAHDLRQIEKKRPELLEIVEAMQAPKDGAKQQPYFGCVATTEGRKYLMKAGLKQ